MYNPRETKENQEKKKSFQIDFSERERENAE